MNSVNTANAFDLKCLSLNVRGLHKSIKRRTVFRWLHKQNHHIIFWQESYCSKNLEPIWENEWGGKAFFSHGTNRSKGVITLINPSVNFKVERVIPDKQGRFIILKLLLEEKVTVLVNNYASNDVAQQVSIQKTKPTTRGIRVRYNCNLWRLQLRTHFERQKRRKTCV